MRSRLSCSCRSGRSSGTCRTRTRSSGSRAGPRVRRRSPGCSPTPEPTSPPDETYASAAIASPDRALRLRVGADVVEGPEFLLSWSWKPPQPPSPHPSPTPPRTGRSRPSTRPCGPAEATQPWSRTSSPRSAASSSTPSTSGPGSASSTSRPAPAPPPFPPPGAAPGSPPPTSPPSCSRSAGPRPRPRVWTSTWQTADAEALPYHDAEFDVTISAIGVMFAPHHQQAADELVRVSRPGGTVAVLNWTPEGFIGQVFAAMKPYAPPPPPGASPAPLWGRADHVPDPVRRPGHRPGGAPADPAGGPLHRRRGVPRVHEGQLRPHPRGVPLHRRRPGQGHRPGRRSRRPG